MKITSWMLCGVFAFALSSIAVAQESYPSSPIRIVLGYTPGGTGDLIARQLAQKLSTQMNANVFVDNKPGASGNIATEFVVKSKPDGYTVLFNTPDIVLSAALGEKQAFDSFKDLTPVTLVATVPQLILLHPSLPTNSVPEFVAYVKSNPNKLAYGSSGTGSFTHLSILLFLQSNGLIATHVPYKGVDVNVDLVAGRIQFGMISVGSALPLLKDKRVKALAITSLKRLPQLPDVPTLAETMPGFEIGNWYGVAAAARTPSPIVQKISGEMAKALQEPDTKSKLLESGIVTIGSTPDAYGTFLKAELDRWTKVIKSAGLKTE